MGKFALGHWLMRGNAFWAVVTASLVFGIFAYTYSQRPLGGSEVSSLSPTLKMPTTEELAAQKKTAADIILNETSWVYSSVHDDMRNSDTDITSIRSTNSVDLGFPYGPANRLSLVLVGRDGPPSFQIVIQKGQADCNYSGCIGHIKFGDGKVQQLNLEQAPSGFSDTLFVKDNRWLLKQITAAESFTIEFPLYGHGSEQFQFRTKPLRPPPAR